MTQTNKGNAEREAHWRGHVAAWSRSGGSVRGYCRSHGLSEALFHYWKRALNRRAEGAGRGDKQGTRSTSPAFSEVHLVQASNGAAALLEVALRGGRRVRVWPGFDGDTLARVVAVLERVEC